MKFLVSIGLAVICALPTIFFFLIRYTLDPHGFWQEFVLFGVGLWMLGGIQILFFIAFCFIMLHVWTQISER